MSRTNNPIVYTMVNDTNEDTVHLTVFAKGELYPLTNKDKAFGRIMEMISADADELPDDYEQEIVDVITSTSTQISGPALQQLSKTITYDEDQDVLYFEGKPLHSIIATHIRESVNAGNQDFKRLALFMDRLSSNPSRRAREELYNWLTEQHLTIAQDGRFIGYKGLTADSTSVFSGEAYVDGQLVKGQIPNHLGSIITMDRRDVDDYHGTACSVGLHVGTSEYASGFGEGLTATVLVDPADVVSVPDSIHASASYKIRCCRYQIWKIERNDLFAPIADYTVDTDLDHPDEEDDHVEYTECYSCDTAFKINECCDIGNFCEDCCCDD